MNNKKYFFGISKGGFVLNTMILTALTGCLSYADAQGIRITLPSPVIVVAPPVVVAQDDYVYYPSYGIYYNTRLHQYAYPDHGSWVSRPAPMGVSADVLLASPSVKMDFHDSPAHHQTDMAKKYPKNYKPDRSDQKADGHDADRHDDQHDDRHDK